MNSILGPSAECWARLVLAGVQFISDFLTFLLFTQGCWVLGEGQPTPGLVASADGSTPEKKVAFLEEVKEPVGKAPTLTSWLSH